MIKENFKDLGFVKLLDQVSSQVLYEGWAPGTKAIQPDTSKAKWLVKRTITQGSGAGRIEYADKPFGEKWSDRATLFNAISLDNSFAVSLDGVNDSLDAGDKFNFGVADAFTVSTWLKPQNIAASRIIFSKAGAGPNVRGYMLRHNATTGKLFLQMRSPSDNRSHTFNHALTASVYQHLVFTYAGGSNINGSNLYLNSIIDTSTVSSGTLGGDWLEGQSFIFGSRNAGFFYSGLMDESTIWNKALSQNEIDELYNSGMPNNPDNHTAVANLVSSWGMGEIGDIHPTIFDRKGTNNLTMINMMSNDFVQDVP